VCYYKNIIKKVEKLKRVPTKYVRDVIKKNYRKKSSCYICNKKSNLELHHMYSLSELFHTWLEKNNLDKDDVNVIRTSRYNFMVDHKEELDDRNCLTLCKAHHERLHNIYGQTYSNSMVPKIKNWVKIQKEKYYESVARRQTMDK